MGVTAPNPAHEFLRLLRKLEYRHSSEAFRSFCELSAITVANSLGNAGAFPKNDAWNRREARYLEIVRAYTKEELEVFAGMFACLVRGLDFRARRESHDFLGRIFMQQLVEGRKDGWDSDLCFTPWSVAYMMARMTLDDATKQVEDRGFITVSEPAAGAGVMVIAAALVLHEQGIDFQQAMHVEAWDIRPICFHMTYLQLSVLNIPAVVIRGDALSSKVFDHWETPAHTLGAWSDRLASRRAAARPVESIVEPSYLESSADRGPQLLFDFVG